jgi:dihydropyrimidinase
VGAPTHVLSHGRVVVQDGKYLGKKGDGRFVKRSQFALR